QPAGHQAAHAQLREDVRGRSGHDAPAVVAPAHRRAVRSEAAINGDKVLGRQHSTEGLRGRLWVRRGAIPANRRSVSRQRARAEVAGADLFPVRRGIERRRAEVVVEAHALVDPSAARERRHDGGQRGPDDAIRTGDGRIVRRFVYFKASWTFTCVRAGSAGAALAIARAARQRSRAESPAWGGSFSSAPVSPVAKRNAGVSPPVSGRQAAIQTGTFPATKARNASSRPGGVVKIAPRSTCATPGSSKPTPWTSLLAAPRPRPRQPAAVIAAVSPSRRTNVRM